MSTAPKPRRWVVSRRRFLIGAGSLGALMLGGVIGLDRGRPSLVEMVEERGTGEQDAPTTPDLWFELTPEGQVIFYTPKIEMGQGIHTALAQIAAEELEIDVQELEVRQAGTPHGFDLGLMFTFGSSSVNAVYTPLRQAAAALREMLRAAAADQLDVAVADVEMARGRGVVRAEPERGLSYGDIIKAKQGAWEVPEALPALKPRSAWTTIGQTIPRVDIAAKVQGEAVYGYDARLPDMLYGAVARPPRFGARLAAATEGMAAQQPGVVKVVIDTEANFAGVVADTRMRARAALAQLDLRWKGGTTISQADIDAQVTVHGSRGSVLRRVGDVDRALTQGRSVEAEYRTPLAAHAHLEPLAALAHVKPDVIEAWVPTQYPQGVISDLQDAFGEERTIQVYPTYLGGGFGRKAGQSAALDAARLSAAVGRPVHVGWTREDDLRHSYFRPPTHTTLRGTVDEQGNILGIEQHTASGAILWSMITFPMSGLVRSVLGFDPGVMLGQFLVYDIPNYRVVNHQIELPIPTGPWRGLGLYPNVFALESFIDELAHQAGADPLEFRLRHLPDTETGQRLRRVLEAAAEKAGWNTPPPPGRARGIACCYDVHTVVAEIAEVSVTDGKIRVHHVTAAVDPGLVINPAGATLHVQGAIMMGISSALHEQITVKDGMVAQGNFHEYPLLTLHEAPTVDVVLLESGDTPFGLGEPPIGPIGAAVANAAFAVTGQRLRSLPLVSRA